MSLINIAKREISCKVVYYGIGLSGKTTNLYYIHRAVNPHDVGEMVSIDTETERTLYFDLLPLELGMVHGFRVRFQLYTVPGQVLYQQTRLSVLRGADCVVFVADSQASKLQENIESFKELTDQLRRMGKNPGEFPIVLQQALSTIHSLPHVRMISVEREQRTVDGLVCEGYCITVAVAVKQARSTPDEARQLECQIESQLSVVLLDLLSPVHVDFVVTL